ncbi:MAG: M28 family metallopeptidase [Gammaproteobacteria bacterium]|nr:M28 family metallopeptidase [Gammaproteobacteria bacterium]
MYRLAALSLLFCAAPAIAATAPPPASALESITPAELMAPIKILSSDEFAGRAPTTAGETKTIHYLRKRFKEMGLEPAWHGKYFQTVPLTEITAHPADFTVTGGGETTTLDYLTDEVAVTKREQETVAVKDSPMVFAGFGIQAPEFDWNDFAGVDVKGKTIVVLVNDPGYYNPDLFHGKNMTYYGRWTYKYEEAARQGAEAVLVVHQTGPAGYGWGVVRNSWSGHQFQITREDKNMGRAAIEGWITHDMAVKLFRQAGLDFAEAKAAALEPGFEAIPLGLKFSVTLHSDISHKKSHNVIAMLPGRERPGEAIVYSAHWDHLGTNATVEGDNIFNGAVDDGSGIGALLALAKAFTLVSPRPERSVVFLATTSEEQGLLGAKYYANHPAIPLAQTVADINMDIMNVYGRTHDLTVIGLNKSELSEWLVIAARAEGMRLEPYPHPETGMFYRTDLLAFARHGVPSIVTASGHDYIGRPDGWGDKIWAEYFAHHYHKPADEIGSNWDLSGLAQQTRALFRLGYSLAESDAWPEWYKGVSFRAARQAQRAPVPATSN